MGSYLARARYIPIETCAATLQLMITWVHSYAEKQTCTEKSNADATNFDLHRTYYSLCQTIFYIVIFRSRQLFGERLLALVQAWKLNDLVSCKLNPLKYCLPTIRDKFAKVAYANRVAYCYSIIDANNRVSLPYSSQLAKKNFFAEVKKSSSLKNGDKKASTVLVENPLDSFFPFDPYLLKRSKNFIEEIYVEFSQVDEESGDEIDEDSEDDEEDEEDEDNDEENETDEEMEEESEGIDGDECG